MNNNNNNNDTTNVITPIELASRLEKELKPITSNNVPPQMIYNYLTNDVRGLKSVFSSEIVVKNKDGKSVKRVVFEENKAIEFISIMVNAAKKRIEKKKAKEENK